MLCWSGRDPILGNRFHVFAQQDQRRGVGLESAVEDLIQSAVAVLPKVLD